jgi:hypothetical protein
MLYLWQLFDLTVESSILDIGGNEFNGMLFKSSSNVTSIELLRMVEISLSKMMPLSLFIATQ